MRTEFELTFLTSASPCAKIRVGFWRPISSEVNPIPETVIRRLQRLVQEAQKKLYACQEKDRIETSGSIGFNRHRKDPCDAEKKALAELED